MELWPHQRRAIDDVSALMNRGCRRILVTSPTGGGKTVIMEKLLEWGFSSVLYTNRIALREQTGQRLADAGFDFGVRASGVKPRLLEKLQLSSIQTERARVYQKRKWELHDASLVLVDEAHLQAADTALQVMNDHVEAGATVVGMTATPIGLGHAYDELVVAGTTSELRECGALVPAVTFAPDEPAAENLKETADGGLTEPSVRKAMPPRHLFGRVIENWRRLNPDQKSTILFAPGVKESLYFAEQFQAAGVDAAHIDGENVWIRGQWYDPSPEVRTMLRKEAETGRVKVVCNRFVLREGIDWPFLYHGIFATAFSSLSSYLQSGGRLLRAHPSLDHVCVSRGTLILTDRGEVPIEQVTRNDLVWDGVEFVSHDGPLIVGHKEVIEWCGLTATPDHKVLTDAGWETLASAKSCNRGIVRSGFRGQAIRLLDDSDPYRPESWAAAGSRSDVRLRPSIIPEVPQAQPSHATRLRKLYASLWRSLSGVDLSSRAAPVETVHRPKGNHISPLRRAWNSIQIWLSLRSYVLDCAAPWSANGYVSYLGSYRQQWALRTWQSALGNGQPANEEPRENHQAWQPLPEVLGGLSGSWIFHRALGLSVPRGPVTGPDCGAMEDLPDSQKQIAEVWDLVNCGPRHRYTAAGVLVGNCIQDHGGNWHRHGSLNSDRQWNLEHSHRVITGVRAQRLREKSEPEPIVCPRCSAVRLWGRQCERCGHESRTRSRQVLQSDGTLKEMKGDIYKPRRRFNKPGFVQQWRSMYYRAKNAGMTFAQAEAVFAKEHDWIWPPRTLPLMPLRETDWFLRVADVPYDQLTGEKRTAQRAAPVDDLEDVFA